MRVSIKVLTDENFCPEMPLIRAEVLKSQY
jgi:hypothetical protein